MFDKQYLVIYNEAKKLLNPKISESKSFFALL